MGPQGAFDLRHNPRVNDARPHPSGFGGRGERAPCGLQRREGREKEGNGWVCGDDGCMEERGGRRREGVGMGQKLGLVCAYYGLKKPPYILDALEPYMSQRTLEVHWEGHHRNYVEGLNKQLEKSDVLYGYIFYELVKATYNNGNPLPEFNNAAQVNTHLTLRPILLTRHGESKDNVRGRIGEDNPLSFISVYYTIWFCLIIRLVPLKEEVTTLRSQLAVHGEEMKAYVGHVRDLV
nr:uncharacterized protein LOC114825503 [Malus domestica]